MSNLPSTQQDILKIIAGAKAATERVISTGGKPFLKLARSGDWVYGTDETDVEDGSEWAINPRSLMSGFTCWIDGENQGDEMALTTEPPIIKSELPYIEGGQWDEQVGFELKCLSGSDETLEVIFKSCSKGGKDAFKKLTAEIYLRGTEGNTDIVPVVTLECDKYRHKKYGTIFTPELNIVRWLTLDGLTSEPPEALEAPEVEEEVIEEAPPKPTPKTRQRRRRATA